MESKVYGRQRPSRVQCFYSRAQLVLVRAQLQIGHRLPQIENQWSENQQSLFDHHLSIVFEEACPRLFAFLSFQIVHKWAK